MAKSVIDIVINAVNKTKKGLTEPITDLKSLKENVAAVGPAFKVAAVAAVGALAYMVKGSIDAADNFSKMSQRTGETTEELSTLAHAAELSGVSVGAMEKGLKKLSQNMYDASRGLKESEESFEALGVSVKNSDGSLRSTTDVMKDVSDKLATMKDGAAKTALMVKLFGKSGADMIPMLNNGSAAINEMQQEARDLGLEISGATGRAAEQFNDNLDRLQKGGTGFANKVMAAVVPSLATLTDAFVASSKQGGVMQKVADGIGAVLNGIVASAFAVSSAFSVVGSGIAALGVAAAQAFKGDFAGAKDTLANFKKDAAKEFDGLAEKWKSIYNPPPTAPVIARVNEIKVTNLEAIKEIEAAKKKAAAEVEKADKESMDRLGELMRAMADADKAIAESAEQKRVKAEQDAERRIQIEQEISALERSLAIERMATEDQEFALLESNHIERMRRIDELQAKGMDTHTSAKMRANEIDLLDERITQARIERVKRVMDANGVATSALTKGMMTFNDSTIAGNKKIEKAFQNMWLAFREGVKQAAAQAAAQLIVTKAAAALTALFWAPAATSASIASLGTAAAGGTAAYGAALATGKSLAAASVIAHGGLTNVPKESTYFLDKGERVLSPKQNKDFTDFMAGKGGGGPTTVTVNLDGRAILKHVQNGADNGQLTINARAVK